MPDGSAIENSEDQSPPKESTVDERAAEIAKKLEKLEERLDTYPVAKRTSENPTLIGQCTDFVHEKNEQGSDRLALRSRTKNLPHVDLPEAAQDTVVDDDSKDTVDDFRNGVLIELEDIRVDDPAYQETRITQMLKPERKRWIKVYAHTDKNTQPQAREFRKTRPDPADEWCLSTVYYIEDGKKIIIAPDEIDLSDRFDRPDGGLYREKFGGEWAYVVPMDEEDFDILEGVADDFLDRVPENPPSN